MDAVGPILTGNAQAQQYTDQAAIASRQAQDVSLQALQASGQRRDQLRSSLATIAADRVQGGGGLDSPSGIAINAAVTKNSNANEAIQNVGYQNQRQSLLWGAQDARSAASNAITAGWINSFSKVGSDVAAAKGY